MREPANIHQVKNGNKPQNPKLHNIQVDTNFGNKLQYNLQLTDSWPMGVFSELYKILWA